MLTSDLPNLDLELPPPQANSKMKEIFDQYVKETARVREDMEKLPLINPRNVFVNHKIHMEGKFSFNEMKAVTLLQYLHADMPFRREGNGFRL